MEIGLDSAALRRRPWRAPRGLPAYAVLGLIGLFLFFDPRTSPLELWDESRIAVNAIEMHLKGLSLVTTYGFAPDLWNTKPPLLIWLINLAMAVIGPSEAAVRLPSALAATGTLAITFAMTRKATGSLWAAVFAVAVLALSVGFFGEHGARVGDYDALLSFLTTAYLWLLFYETHRRRPRPWRLLAAAGLVAAAGLTKSVAGLAPGVGLVAYLVVVGRWRRPFQSVWYPVAAVVALAPILAFYGLREAAAPGYLAAVWGNDVSNRFLTALDRHGGPPWYYFDLSFWFGLFSAGPAAVLAPAALLRTRGKTRQILLFALCAALAFMAAIGFSSTKLPQYGLPAYPLLATACGIALHTAVRVLGATPDRARRRLWLQVLAGAVTLVMCVALAKAAFFRFVWFPHRAYDHQGHYGELFADLARRGARRVVVLDGGVEARGVPDGYSAQLRFYSLLWSSRGLAIEHRLAGAPGAGLTATCDPALLPGLAVGARLEPAGCAVIERPDAG